MEGSEAKIPAAMAAIAVGFMAMEEDMVVTPQVSVTRVVVKIDSRNTMNLMMVL